MQRVLLQYYGWSWRGDWRELLQAPGDRPGHLLMLLDATAPRTALSVEYCGRLMLRMNRSLLPGRTIRYKLHISDSIKARMERRDAQLYAHLHLPALAGSSWPARIRHRRRTSVWIHTPAGYMSATSSKTMNATLTPAAFDAPQPIIALLVDKGGRDLMR